MATADGMVEDTFLCHVESVLVEIQDKFMKAHNILQYREANLRAELQRLIDEYTGEGIVLQIKELSASKVDLRNRITLNENKDFLEKQLANSDARIAELNTKLQKAQNTFKSVSLEWDVELEKKLIVAGEIRLNAVKEAIRDYNEIGDPVAVFGKLNRQESSSTGVFCYPKGIAINPVNDSIYICDSGNHRVQVYDKSLKFVLELSENMKSPVGICIKQRNLYVTQYGSHCLNVYSTGGKYLDSVGEKGKKELEFDQPRGLDVSTVKDRIYIAEFGNERIQCLYLDNLKFNSFIEDISGAKDVKLTSNEIIVLSNRNPCVSLYTYSHKLMCEIIPCGQGDPILTPYFLILDGSSNILITDYGNHSVSVFTFEGELLHRFGREGEDRGEFIMPAGIAIDSLSRILVVSDNPNHCVQIF